MNADAVVIGAGLAGLCCARELIRAGVSTRVIEASDAVGGRVRTDRVQGFLLDRGFQVLLTAYPECRRLLDYPALDLHAFFPGALVRFEGRFHRVGDPWRAPASAMETLFSPVGSLADKLRIARLRASLGQYSLAELFERHETTTRERLASLGFSAAILDRFFRPFFGGIFLEPELRTSSRMFDFVFRMLAEGDIAVPAQGMAAIPQQLARAIPPETIEFNRRVQAIEEVEAKIVVIATDGPECARLIGTDWTRGSRGVWCYYFATDHPPSEETAIFLNGDGTGPVNNCAILTNVAPEYAPTGSALISATVLETAREHSEKTVREQLAHWWDLDTSQWQFLRPYYLAHAQPEQAPPSLTPAKRSVKVRPDLYQCGDHRDNASINGAMNSGFRTAAAILGDLGIRSNS